MTSVFVSHSKDDSHIRKFFAEIFADIGLKATFMELKNLTGKYAGDIISKTIRAGILSGSDTAALFVMLGDGLENPPNPEFTHNWVAFEAGAAAGCLKPVWVFEEFGKFIKFPTPFVTDYVLYALDDVTHLQFLGQLFTQEIVYPNSVKKLKPTSHIKCPYDDCNAEYRIWSQSSSINCPVCRRGINV